MIDKHWFQRFRKLALKSQINIVLMFILLAATDKGEPFSQVIKFDIYFLVWFFMLYYCFIRPAVKQDLKKTSLLMIAIIIPVTLVELLIIPDSGSSRISGSILIAFIVCSLLSGVFHLLALREYKNPYLAIIFSLESAWQYHAVFIGIFYLLVIESILHDIIFPHIDFYFSHIAYITLGIIAIGFPAWFNRLRCKAWNRAVYFSRSMEESNGTLVPLVFHKTGTAIQDSIFNWTIEKRMDKGFYTKGAGRDIDIIRELEAVLFEYQQVKTIVLSPLIWEMVSKRLSFKKKILIYIQFSDTLSLSKTPKPLLEEQINQLKQLKTLPKTFIFAYHVEKKGKKKGKNIKVPASEESQWISQLKELAVNEKISCENFNEPMHYLPERIKDLVNNFLSHQHVWQRFEAAAQDSLPELTASLPAFVGEYFNKLQQDKRPFEIFYGLSKALEMLIHFYALAAVALVTKTRSQRKKSTFALETEAAALGHWREIGRTYVKKPEVKGGLLNWWECPLDKEIAAAIKRLLQGLDARLSRMKTMEDLHEFVIVFRNKIIGHGVLSHKTVFALLADLAAVTGYALGCAAKTGIQLILHHQQSLLQYDSLQLEVHDLILKQEQKVFLLSAHHQSYPEYICYQTGDLLMAKGFKIKLCE